MSDGNTDAKMAIKERDEALDILEAAQALIDVFCKRLRELRRERDEARAIVCHRLADEVSDLPLDDARNRPMTGVEIITAERRRQTEEEGWDPEHDDGHTGGELAMAAVCYAAPRPILVHGMAGSYGAGAYRDPWPWSFACDKRPRDESGVLRAPTREERRRMLAKAGALIAAELDRLAREDAQGGEG